jgi:very-short-patch-repair endonuclease
LLTEPHPDPLPRERETGNLKQNEMFQSKEANFENAKNSRKKPTTAEVILWEHLRNRKFLGLKFRRQCPIYNYVVDFFCYELKLAIEVDGRYHLEERQIQEDIERTKCLNSFGISVFRLNNEETSDPFTALGKIKTFIESNIKAPSPKGEGGG